jgi:hemolysin activation/secretion protein
MKSPALISSAIHGLVSVRVKASSHTGLHIGLSIGLGLLIFGLIEVLPALAEPRAQVLDLPRPTLPTPTAPELLPTFPDRPPLTPAPDSAPSPPSLNQPDAPQLTPGQLTPGQLTPASSPQPICRFPPIAPSGSAPIPPNALGQDEIRIQQLEILGSTAFTCGELQQLLEAQLGQSLSVYVQTPRSFPELLQLRSAITQIYLDRKYLTTGAYLPQDQELDSNQAIVKIQVLEGKIEQINITGNRRLRSDYVRSRLKLGSQTPLNETQLLASLRLLQINPLIDSLAAELRAGTQPGGNILDVQVQEADPWSAQVSYDNRRIPSVGSLRRGLSVSHANVLGFGDGLSLGYSNTEGSNGLDVGYSFPLNAHNGTLGLNYGRTRSRILEDLEALNIGSLSEYYQVTLRQPIVQTLDEELALSIGASINRSQTTLDGEPIPLSAGADESGLSQVTALRLTQEWTKQWPGSVLSARSQLSLGLGALGATVNPEAPDSRFTTWQGQLYWLKVLGRYENGLPTAPTLLLQGRAQFADRPLLSSERFGLGGAGSVRGYRQDVVVTDSGWLGSLEVQLPLLKLPQWRSMVQIIPFVEGGRGWNRGEFQPQQQTLAAVGLGLRLVSSQRLTARLDWGLPLLAVPSSRRSWQERGFHFSVDYKLF